MWPRHSGNAKMIKYSLWLLVVAAVWGLSMASNAEAGSEAKQPLSQLLPGNRVVLGTVMEVRSGQARIDIGQGQPRFVPMGVRAQKELPALKKFDLVHMTVNEQNLLVDVHKVGESGSHRLVRGRLAGPLVTGHDKAILRSVSGAGTCHFIRPVARSKMASIPVGADAVFLLDELDRVADVVMSGPDVVHQAAGLGLKKSPIKGNLRQVPGKILKPFMTNRLIIRTEAGTKHSFEVCPLIRQRLAQLSSHHAAVFFVSDETNIVMDVAYFP